MIKNRIENIIRSLFDIPSSRAIIPYFYFLPQYVEQKKKALRNIHLFEINNQKKLTRKMKHVADDYAKEVFGSKRYSPWLCFYTLVRGEFKEGWIPRNFYEDVIIPIVNTKIRLCDSKTFTNVVLKTDLLPNIAYYIDGVFYNRNFEIMPMENVQELIFASSAEVFIKHDLSLQGLV